MKTIIQPVNIELSDALLLYAQRKLVGEVMKFKRIAANPAVELRIEIGKSSLHHRSGKVYYAEVNCYVPGELLRVTVQDNDLRAAIDKIKDKLGRLVRKYLTKIEKKR